MVSFHTAAAGTILAGNTVLPAGFVSKSQFVAHVRGLLGSEPVSGATGEIALYSYGHFGTIQTSALATALAISIDTRNMAKTLAIQSVASASIANLTIEASVDNFVSSDITIDTIAAAATITKQYTETTVGIGVALSPLAFRYLKITAGSAGVGNTTTLTIAMK